MAQAWRVGALCSQSNNLLTSRWVLKMKNGKVKARLTVQGFKDRQKVENYSGTTTRWGQRLILILAAQFRWELWSADVSEAFLRGLTFKELQKQGEPIRSVQLELPPGSVPLFRQLPGMETFDSIREVLNMLRPGYGLKDAPRLWNLALRRALIALDLVATTCDPELYVKHSGGRLVLIVSTHVDDLKLAGELGQLKAAIQALEKEFDQMKVQKAMDKDGFEHCGVVHRQRADYSIEVSQAHYAAQLKPIDDSLALHMKADEPLTGDLYAAFRSLLGGVAWMGQTRPDASVYISALQRVMDKPAAQHVMSLNRVLKYIKRKPLTTVFKALAGPWRLAVISDSAFQAKEPDCLTMRSGIIALVSNKEPAVGKMQVQPLEHVCTKQNHVCRSTYAAELHSALDLLGLGMLINQTLTEVLTGVAGAAKLLTSFQNGDAALKMDLYIDAKSVFDSIAAAQTKTPADKIFLLHVLAIRDHLKLKQLNSISWIDTRDMIADALNKGKIDRGPLQQFYEYGIWNICHSPSTFRWKD